jgi:Ser/Thr protein kinase RdoA (MazF antagonist)
MPASFSTYSTFNIDALTELLESAYDIGKVRLVFLKRGFNDTYRVDSDRASFILRVYRFGRRHGEDIRSELHILNHLHAAGNPISVPVPDRKGETIQNLTAAEGVRQLVLFTFTEGLAIRKPDLTQCYKTGEALASIHKTLENYDPGILAWNYEPDKVFAFVHESVSQSLKSYPADLKWLSEFERKFSERIKSCDLSRGICHGDLQSENFYFSHSGEVSFIDFDFCGRGPLLYDLGAYTWYDHGGKSKEMLKSFYSGYSSIRRLSTEELALIPWFGALRGLFLMGMWNRFNDGVSNPTWPPAQISAFVAKLRKWVPEHCGPVS